MANHFDILSSPLSGINLIEASAGTGKTYSIAGIFLRLLLEKELTVRDILVVTFTVPATQELKDRTRTIVRAALQAFSGEKVDDQFIATIVTAYPDHARARRLLTEALQDFDEASVFTIHGFCQRILLDYAFETGSFFGTELVTDQSDYVTTIARDFWRRRLTGESALFLSFLSKEKIRPETFAELAFRYAEKPLLRVIPDTDYRSAEETEKNFSVAFEATRAMWESERNNVHELLLKHPGLNRNRYSVSAIGNLMELMDDYLLFGSSDPRPDEKLRKFCGTTLAQSINKGALPPSHLFFAECERLFAAADLLAGIFSERLIHYKRVMLAEAGRRLAALKQGNNVQSFDDLLNNLHEALQGKGAAAIRKAVRKRYAAALVDEFQDTDPIQYGILASAFMTGDNPALFLIGDPKQAIYSFRGADIFTYLQACKAATCRYTLPANWRSTSGLVSAVNTLFSTPRLPFVFQEIGYFPATAAGPADQTPLVVNGALPAPLTLWFVKTSGHPSGATAYFERLIARSVTGEIASLLTAGLEHKALIGSHPVCARDIAVLVRTNKQANLIQEVLADAGIPSVLHTTDDVFDAHEVAEMQRILAATAEPHHEAAIRSALLTEMLGLQALDIEKLANDEAAWESTIVRFRQYHDLWISRGFMSMFRTLLIDERVKERLIRYSDGERRLTNVLHLAELIHRHAAETRATPRQSLAWLSRQKRSTLKPEEHQIRLDKDENAVTIATVHRSKGLDYPIAFVPFLWNGSPSAREECTFHADGMTPTLDLGSEDHATNRQQADLEALSESCRLLYVALTRAKYRCYLVWGPFKDAAHSAIAYLMHQPHDHAPEGNYAESVAARVAGLSEKEMFDETMHLNVASKGAIEVALMPETGPGAHVASRTEPDAGSVRTFSGTIRRDWRIASFSSLTAGAHNAEMPDYDAAAVPAVDAHESSGIFAFPRGAKAGTFMHEIFERIDFRGSNAPQQQALILDRLQAFGFESSWLDPVRAMVDRVLNVKLHNTFSLGRLEPADRLHEVEFYFPLKSISRQILAELFPNSAPGFPERIGALTFSPTRGFMKGFIDLIFRHEDRYYLVDWKSNHLGDHPGDYGEKALRQAMAENFYILQYHLYAIALDRYLRVRVSGYRYETHFGGVYYIFLRGVDESGSGNGIFRHRPDHDSIAALHRALIDIQEPTA